MAKEIKKESDNRNHSCGMFAGGYDVIEDDIFKKSVEKLIERKKQELDTKEIKPIPR
jgi:hypothetical protein